MKAIGEFVRLVESIAREAGAAILTIYTREFLVERKADESPLTEADSAANGIILTRLANLVPSLPILSEESVADFGGPDPSGRYWLVDPLDGTKEFIERNGEFTVNIALVEQGRPVLGVVYAPVPDLMFLAAVGEGAFKIQGGGTPERMQVASHAEGAPWRVVGSRSHAGDSLAGLLQRLGPHELISMGSSLKFCLVADGDADVYPRLGPTSLWDTGAAQCIVEQAGGSVIQMNGKPLSYETPSKTLNPFFIVHGKSSVDWPALVGADAA